MFFFFKQKTAYEMRISDWSSDVCSSDLHGDQGRAQAAVVAALQQGQQQGMQFARFLGREQAQLAGRDRGDADRAQRLLDARGLAMGRSEERRAGKECVSTCRSRWPPDP